MDDETQQIFKEQFGKLPAEVVGFISSANWDENLDEIGSLYNLSEDEAYNFKQEATLVLAGLVHPDEFGDNLEQEAGIHGAVRDAIVTAVEQKIFAPVRSALVEFLSQEGGGEGVESEKLKVESGEKEATPEEVTLAETPEVKEIKSTAWKSGSAPDNLPVAEIPEYLVPPIPPKTADPEALLEVRLLEVRPPNEEAPAHPFEEKMKRIFTAGRQSMGDLTLAPVAPQAPSTAHTPYDPYREAIE
ncbi:MAG: hypothetical protein AAB497_03130 [Patescibacteria group bacterium]